MIKITDNLDDFYSKSNKENWVEFFIKDENKILLEISISSVDEKQPIEIMYVDGPIHPRYKIFYTEQSNLIEIVKYLSDNKIHYIVDDDDKLKTTYLIFKYQ